jgi:hypothetical protein
MLFGTCIYVLLDPRTGAPRYVGRTTEVRTRFAKHAAGVEHSPLGAWCRELRAEGLAPVLEVPAVVTRGHPGRAESRFIRYFRDRGEPLLNRDSGQPWLALRRAGAPRRFAWFDRRGYEAGRATGALRLSSSIIRRATATSIAERTRGTGGAAGIAPAGGGEGGGSDWRSTTRGA